MNDKKYTDTNIEDLTKAVSEMCNKYERLVWFARSPHKSVIHEVYKDTPEHIIQGSLNGQARVEEMFPEECDALYGEASDWNHGFHSGMQAALRFVLTASRTYHETDEDEGDFDIGGIDYAKEMFPDLDS